MVIFDPNAHGKTATKYIIFLKAFTGVNFDLSGLTICIVSRGYG